MIGNLFDRMFNRIQDEEEQHRDCSTCFYYKDGHCFAVSSNDCKDNNHFLWYPNDDED